MASRLRRKHFISIKYGGIRNKKLVQELNNQKLFVMKKKFIKKYITAILVAAIILVVQTKADAQNRKKLDCYTGKADIAAIKKAIEFEKTGKTEASTKYQLKLYLHIVANTSGQAPATNNTELQTEMAALSDDFRNAGVCFVVAGINQINSDELNYYEIDKDDNGDKLAPYNISGCLNVYYNQIILGTNGASGGTIGGVAFDVPGVFCVVTKGSLGGHTTSHEVGHCLGLFHTFEEERFGEELISGEDCDELGDLICDTEADPYSHKNDGLPYSACFTTDDDGFYDGYCQDEDGRTSFDPPYNNIMSYWRFDPESFTNGQFSRVRAIQATSSIFVSIQSVNSVEITTPIVKSSGHYHLSALNTLTYNTIADFSKTSVTSLLGKTVILKSGFRAYPSSGLMLIQPTECNSSWGSAKTGKSTTTATTSKNNTATQKAELPLIYPNPTTGIIYINYKSVKEFKATITIRNMYGQVVYNSQQKNSAMYLQERINIGDNPKGIYIVEINTGNAKLISKVLLH